MTKFSMISRVSQLVIFLSVELWNCDLESKIGNLTRKTLIVFLIQIQALLKFTVIGILRHSD